jgi:hypothetical protein
MHRERDRQAPVTRCAAYWEGLLLRTGEKHFFGVAGEVRYPGELHVISHVTALRQRLF